MLKKLGFLSTVILLIMVISNIKICAQSHSPRLNKVIQMFEKREPAFGIFSGDRSYKNLSALADSELDFIFIDMEHSPYDIHMLQSCLLSMISRQEILEKGNLQPNCVPIVRIPANGAEKKEFMVKQALDVGAYGIMFPHVDSPEQARDAVNSCRFPQEKGASDYYQKGYRGAGNMDCARYWGISYPEYIDKADTWPLDPNGELLAVIQIESPEAIEQIDDILEVPGIGAIFIGPFDLTFSMGYPKDYAAPNPPVEKEIQKVLNACTAKNIPCGIIATAENVEQRIREGFLMITVGADAGLSVSAGEALKKAKRFLSK